MSTAIHCNRKAQRRALKRERARGFHVEANAFAETRGKAGGLSRDGRVFVVCRKVKYPWRSTAQQAARAMQSKKGAEFDSYYCRRCRAWHIGNAQRGSHA